MKRRFKYIITLISLMFVQSFMGVQAFTVVLDAGHGGKDPGSIGSSRSNREKDINLAVVLEIGRLLKVNYPGIKVVYTRTDDRFLELGRRAEIANNAKADLFISVHVNALPRGGAQTTGVQSYTLSLKTVKENLEVEKRENSVIKLETKKYNYSSEDLILSEVIQGMDMKGSVAFAKMAQDEMVWTGGRKNRGVRQANLAVLRLTYMPSCLLEIGFISQPDEERYLMSTSGRNNIARCIYNAIIKFKKSL